MEQVTIRQLLDACRGPRTRRELCKQLGVTERYLHAVYHGERKPGIKVFEGIYRNFPQFETEIIALFLARIGKDASQKVA